MIIAIDGYEANVKNRVGIGRYAYEIIKNIYLLAVSCQPCLAGRQVSAVSFRIYLPSPPISDMPRETERWKYRVISPKRFWTFVGLPLALQRDQPRADVVFSPTHYVPRYISIPRVMSIMDLSYLAYPKMFRFRDLYKLVLWTKYSVANAARICTISEFTKNAIMREYGVPEDRVVVTYPGLSMESKATKKYNISSHYILSVGTLQPRKNYVRLIEAFAEFLRENKQKFGELHLVIIGKKGWLYEEILEAPTRFGVSDKVKFLHDVPDGDLPDFYSHALCFALPSLYEGFGLPVLEAMAYKAPIVASNISSLPEIAGQAAVYIDPLKVKSITQGLLTAVRQRNLVQGKTRIQKGLAQVKLFSWEKAAKQTLEVLQEVGTL